MFSTKLLGVVGLAIILSFVISDAQKSQECDQQKMDEATRWLFFFGDPKRKIPETEADRSKFCTETLHKESYVKNYAKKCLKAFPFQVTTLLMFGVVRKNKYYCSFKRGKKDIVAMAKCLNSIKSNGNKCMNKLIEEAIATIPLKDNSVKIASICCNYYKFEECVSHEASESPSPHCTHDSVILIEQLLEGYTGQMLGHICTQYRRETDQCSKISPSPLSKPLNTTVRYKSILPPFIEILESIPA